MSRPEIEAIERGQPGFPAELEGLPDPPKRIWARGRVPSARRVAIVGARGADLAGRRFAFDLASAVAGAGLVVVSGGARGIDRAAHDGALAAGAPTIAVLGCGADVAYPPEHRELLDEIGRVGAVLSELDPGTPPLRGSFLRRNRLIAALGSACVVVQADERSGSLSTARIAAKLGRPVLAVPWGPEVALGRGTAQLLRQGARVATRAGDVLDALGVLGTPSEASTSGDPVRPVRRGLAGELLASLGASRATVDDLVVQTGARSEVVSTTLLTLELDGLVVRSDCGVYERAR